MNRVTAQDKEEFQGYLAACSDRQVRGVYEKEKQANRRAYAQLAKEELVRRGLD